MHIRTPPIDQSISEFANSLFMGGTLLYLDIEEIDGALTASCNVNVTSLVDRYGGEGVSGWALWSDADKYLTAEAHVVWRTPDGQLIDVTPRQDGLRKTLFLAQPYDWPPEGFMPESRHWILDDSKVVRATIMFHRGYYHLRIRNGGTPKEDELLSLKKSVIMVRDGNFKGDLCLCMSGLRFSECCGRPLGVPDSYAYPPL